MPSSLGVCLFALRVAGIGMPTLPDKLNPYLQSSPSVVSPIHELPCGGHIGGLDFNNSYLSASFNPCPRPHPLVDLLGRSTSDTSPPKKMVSLMGWLNSMSESIGFKDS